LVIGAIIGGTFNWAAHGAKFNMKGLGYFGVGAAAGALGAGVGAGISSSIAGGSFGAGFIGSSAAMTAKSSFLSGAAIGGGVGATSGFMTGFGNGLLDNRSFGKSIGQGLIYGGIGLGSGALLGGIAGGIDAAKNGRRFWDGATVTKETLVDLTDVQGIMQRGRRNCAPANVESVDKSLGGNLTQEDVRGWFPKTPNPDTDLLYDGEVWNKYSEISGHEIFSDTFEPGTLDRILTSMKTGERVSINLNTNNGHSVVMKSIIKQTITKPSGRSFINYMYRVMDPQFGSFINVSSRSILNSRNIIYILP
jgi:hypothetical protein